jgi:cytochrome c oxidase subunit 2
MKRIGHMSCLAAALLSAGCQNSQSALDVHGTSALELRHLILLFVVVCSAVWLAVVLVLMRALWRRRQETQAAGPEREAKLRFAVLVAVVGTVVVISGLTLASFLATHRIDRLGDPALTVRVRGQQWWWQVVYPDSNPALAFEVANEIHIPVGKNVRLELEGVDVIHSFWVPSLAGKQDLVPGRENALTIRAEQPGVYRGQCAEFCGLQHSHMAVLVVAQSEADYARWAAAQRQQAAAPGSPEADAGRAVFMRKPCGACHTIRGTAAAGKTGPDLTHVGSRRTIAAGLFETTRGSLAAWIADPQTLKPGNNMPMVPLTSEELRALSAYLESLK